MHRFTLVLILGMFAVPIIGIVLRRVIGLLFGPAWRRLFGWIEVRAAAKEEPAARCRCGYDLRGQAVPRCPECGRAVGFDKSFEELGLTPDELQRLQARRDRGEEQGGGGG